MCKQINPEKCKSASVLCRYCSIVIFCQFSACPLLSSFLSLSHSRALFPPIFATNPNKKIDLTLMACMRVFLLLLLRAFHKH